MTLAIAHSVDDGDQVAQSLRTRTFGTKSGDCVSRSLPYDYMPSPLPKFSPSIERTSPDPEIFYRIQRKSDRLWLILNVDQQPFWTPDERASRLFAERDMESAIAIAELSAAGDYDLVPYHLRRLTRVFELNPTTKLKHLHLIDDTPVEMDTMNFTGRSDDCREAHDSD